MEEPQKKEVSFRSDTKVFAVLGYLFPPLFFIPLLNEKMKDEPSVRFHANQQIILLIGYLGLIVISNIVVFGFSMVVYSAIQLINLGLFALGIFGAYYTYKDEQKELPLIGHFKILK